MITRSPEKSFRFRYLVGLSAIALLVTASYMSVQRVVSEQRNYSQLVNLAGHQAGLANRIAYFASLMATTEDEADFDMAKGQVGRTIHKMEDAHHILRNGSADKGIPFVNNENLETIYQDPMVGLDLAVKRFLDRARSVYNTGMDDLDPGAIDYIFLTTYGPHVLEPMFDSAVSEYETIGREAILNIENVELGIWVAALVTLLLEAGFIFLPLEKTIRQAIESLQGTVGKLSATRERLLSAQELAHVGDWRLDAHSTRFGHRFQRYPATDSSCIRPRVPR